MSTAPCACAHNGLGSTGSTPLPAAAGIAQHDGDVFEGKAVWDRVSPRDADRVATQASAARAPLTAASSGTASTGAHAPLGDASSRKASAADPARTALATVTVLAVDCLTMPRPTCCRPLPCSRAFNSAAGQA